jgi:tetratricopeptide (TPR) repeat protein
MAPKEFNRMIDRMLRGVLIVLALAFFFRGEAGAVTCDKILDEYNEVIRLYRFKDALDVLQECSLNCPQQMNICSLQSISMKATIRNYIDVQTKIAREARDINPGAAVRSYRRIIEIGAAYSEKSEVAVAEANKELPVLLSEIDRKIASLVKNGEQAIAESRFERLRDIINELYLLDYGSAKALDLSQSASTKIEESINQESREIDKLLQTLERTVAEATKTPSPGNRERQNKINKVTQTINTKIEASLAMKPGDERINKLYVKAVTTKDHASGKGLKIQLKEPDKQLSESPRKVFQEAIDNVGKGNYSQAIEEIRQAIARPHFDKDGLSIAYMYLGIAYASQIKESPVNTADDTMLRSSAVRAFRRAISFNPKLQLPKVYAHHSRLLEESRHMEDPRIDSSGFFGPK